MHVDYLLTPAIITDCHVHRLILGVATGPTMRVEERMLLEDEDVELD